MTKLDLITGFLGAGKTTFIKRYAKYHMKKNERVAVIENEFGAAGIDTAILRNNDIAVEQLVGGCICCSQKVNFHNLVISLAKEYDRIIVEPSGIFNMDDFFDVAYSPQIQDVCEMGSIITIVDPRSIETMGNEERDMLHLQLISSGTILLSKTTQLSQKEISSSIKQIKDLSGLESIIMSIEWEKIRDWEFESLSKCGYTNHKHIRKVINHAMLFNSTSIYPKPMNKKQLMRALSQMTDGSCGDILRIKGYIMTPEGNSIEINCTARDISIEVCEQKETAVLNIIGKNLNRKSLKQCLGTVL
ncbi:MAG: hypothetical protein K0S71_3047 [Clostridia bacterium]|jgi:G3E family GTPase|nr:hypothetical protein [Clostridia bacterium]